MQIKFKNLTTISASIKTIFENCTKFHKLTLVKVDTKLGRDKKHELSRDGKISLTSITLSKKNCKMFLKKLKITKITTSLKMKHH